MLSAYLQNATKGTITGFICDSLKHVSVDFSCVPIERICWFVYGNSAEYNPFPCVSLRVIHIEQKRKHLFHNIITLEIEGKRITWNIMQK